ncbi:MAG: hypothetical protein ACOCY0_03180 [Roseicyclus sp.]
MSKRAVLVAAAMLVATPAAAQTVAQMREANAAIAEFLDTVCLEADRTTTTSRAEAEARLEIGLDGLLGKLLDIGVLAGGNLGEIEQGVTPEDLAALQQQEAACRQEMTRWVWDRLDFAPDVRSALDPIEAFRTARLENGIFAVQGGTFTDQITLHLSVGGAKFFLDDTAEETVFLGRQRNPALYLAFNWRNETGFTFGDCDLAFQDARDPETTHLNFPMSFMNRALAEYDVAREAWSDGISILPATGPEPAIVGSREFFAVATESEVAQEVLAVLSCGYGVSPDGLRQDIRLEKMVPARIGPPDFMRAATEFIVDSREIADSTLFERIGGHDSPYLVNRIEFGPADLIFE